MNGWQIGVSDGIGERRSINITLCIWDLRHDQGAIWSPPSSQARFSKIEQLSFSWQFLERSKFAHVRMEGGVYSTHWFVDIPPIM